MESNDNDLIVLGYCVCFEKNHWWDTEDVTTREECQAIIDTWIEDSKDEEWTLGYTEDDFRKYAHITPTWNYNGMGGYADTHTECWTNLFKEMYLEPKEIKIINLWGKIEKEDD